MILRDLVEKYGDYEVTGIFDNDGDKLDGYVNVGLKRSEPSTVWELNNNDEHYSVTDCGFIKHFDYSDFIGYKRDIGNVFLTEEEAEKDVERKKVEALLLKYGGRRWYKENENDFDFVIIFSTPIKKLWVDRAGLAVQGAIYFDSIEKAEKAIQEIGEDRIKKALFEVR